MVNHNKTVMSKSQRSEDKICIRLFSPDPNTQNITWSLRGIDFAENLVYDILSAQGVGPVYRTLFGLKLINQTVWLAPNVGLRDLSDWSKSSSCDQPQLELRMRYRPSSFGRLVALDKVAFEMIFLQIRHDFLKTRFNDDKRDFVLLNDAVMGLITLDLIRYSIDKKINVDEVIKHVNPKDFIPKRASGWQRNLLFRLAETINLQKSLQLGYSKCDNDLYRLKQRFMELFLTEVAPNYNVEVYNTEDQYANKAQIRVRYQQTSEESQCLIEKRIEVANRDPREPPQWAELCDITTVSHGSIRINRVQIARFDGSPLLYTFETSLHAESYLSAIDGYQRLMRKWNFSLCHEISSPDLNLLRRIKSHGPIGYLTADKKLSALKQPGTFLVRRCMEKNNRYLIDVLLHSRGCLTIDLEYDPDLKRYKKTSHMVTKNMDLTVITDNEDYSSLRGLIGDIQIQVKIQGETSTREQLKFWLPPADYDDCPALLLSISNKRLKDFESPDRMYDYLSQEDLPPMIPLNMLRNQRHISSGESSRSVILATLNNSKDVVVKLVDTNHERLSANLEFHHQHKIDNTEIKALTSRSKFSTWIFLKNCRFAETIGAWAEPYSLVQEYFPLGQLDLLLAEKDEVPQMMALSISHQLSQALVFLQDRHIIHGKIRCHNVFVESAHPIVVKLSDPLGAFDPVNDRAFLPPEFAHATGFVCLDEYQTGIDVWAFGTTLWQIYKRGIRPPPKTFANTLVKPKSCPNNLWILIETCWAIDPSARASPPTLYRDINGLFSWEKDAHDYLYINSADEKPQRPPLPAPEPSVQSNGLTNGVSYSSYEASNGSTITTSTNGSQTNLLRSDAATVFKTIEFNRINRMANQPHGSSFLSDSHFFAKVSQKYKTPWKNIIHFRNSANNQKRANLGHRKSSNFDPGEFSKLQSSNTSISNCSTPSGSEATKFTDLYDDTYRISDALDRCFWEVDTNRIKIGIEIGRGSSSIVFRGSMCQSDSDSEQIVAIKCIDTDCSDLSVNKLNDLRREFDILKNLNHRNIVKILGFVEEPVMMLILEYMPLGSLLSYIRNPHRGLNKLPLKKYAYDIAYGMQYLESMKIIHRDLALRNILLKDDDEVKICDFGLAHFLGSNNHYRLTTGRALPLKWYAPETIETWTFSHKSDVWSYGIVLWEIYSGGNKPQYTGIHSDMSETLKNERLPMPPGCPAPIYNLMLECWAYKPEDRLSFEQICRALEE